MVQSRRTAKPTGQTGSGSTADGVDTGMRVLKKYPNRRLYDTQGSSYITLADVKQMVLAVQPFVVRDAKTGEDLTRSILLQIILEEETGGAPIFSAQMLSQIIRFYGNAMQSMMGSYLEQNLQTFTDIQSRLAEQAKGVYDPTKLSPDLWANYLEQSRQMFLQMQEQLSKQADSMFPGLSGIVPPTR